jgi:hypothetical protein
MFFYKNEPEGFSFYPNFIDVSVDEETGEPWWLDNDRKETPTSWRNPWLKKRLAEGKAPDVSSSLGRKRRRQR